jgi:serine O-acetyltransferase
MTMMQRVESIIERGLSLLHPEAYACADIAEFTSAVKADLEREIRSLSPQSDAAGAAEAFVAAIPEVRRLVATDVEAAYEGDPAATSTTEVVLAYPGVYAVSVHRLAHVLYCLKVPILPRMMSEIAHSKTGIDIHPGASIGERFFIDHGTGVVVGETTVIGRNVKLYQGVTLGALSFDKDPETGMLVKGVKRHPEVGDNVVIYANATILGGETKIGHDSEIGGSVWLISSVPPNSRVYNTPPPPTIRERKARR